MASQLTVYLFPCLLLWAATQQPNFNRSLLTAAIIARNIFYSVIVVFVPDSQFLYTYILDIITAFIVIYALSRSNRDGRWCLFLIDVMLLSIPINLLGGALWLTFSPPFLYNYAMLVINMITVFAIMIDGTKNGRLDGLATSYYCRSLGFMPRVFFTTTNEAQK